MYLKDQAYKYGLHDSETVNMIKYNPLGLSSLRVSQVSFGCMSLGNDQAENDRLLHHALDRGINFFDTADLYQKGLNEVTVGSAFKDKRSQVVIATKVGNQWRPDGSGWDWNPGKDYILQAAEASLKRLQTDYIDLYQLHGGTISDPIDETIEAFELLVQQGKIRYYGISSIRPNVIREYGQRSNISSVMMQYSLLDRRPEEALLDLLKKKNIGVLARGSLAQGILAGKQTKNYLNYTTEEVEKVIQAIRSITQGKPDMAETAMRFVLSNPAVTSAVLGIRTQKQLDDAIKLAAALPLAAEHLHLLQQAITPNIYEQHR